VYRVVCHSTGAKDFVDLCRLREPQTQFFAPGSELGPPTISCHVRFTLEY